MPEKLIYAFLGEDTIGSYAEKHHAVITERIETVTKTYPIYIICENDMEYTLVQATLVGAASAQLLDSLIA